MPFAESDLHQQLLDLRAENAGLREQLAEAESEVRGVLAALGDNAIHSHPDGGTENIYESLAISMARLQSELAQVTSERDEVKRLMVRAVLPCEALLMDTESRKWIAPSIWKEIEATTQAVRKAVMNDQLTNE